MCTAIFIPGKDGVTIASLRDESPARARSSAPTLLQSQGTSFIMPVDPQGGGSWVGLNEHGVAVVLLNGAFERHHHAPPYRMSRGIIVSALLESYTPASAWNDMPMDNIEPYTLVVLERGALSRLTWDGTVKHSEPLNTTTPHLFSSTTLYAAPARAKRVNAFENWMATHPEVNEVSLLHFFHSDTDSQNGFIMNRNEVVKTLSYSYLTLQQDFFEFYYNDFAGGDTRVRL